MNEQDQLAAFIIIAIFIFIMIAIAARSNQFPFVQQVGNGELKRQAEAGFQKGAAFEIDKNGGIGDQNLHPAQPRAAASEAGGSSIRRFRS